MTAPAVQIEETTGSAHVREDKRHAGIHEDEQETLLHELLDNDAAYHTSGIETKVGRAQNVLRAKRELVTANFERFTAQMKLDASDISVYITIAKNKHLTNSDNWQFLPSGMTVLVILARYTMDMTSGDFNRLTASKKIHPKLKRVDARKLAGLESKRTAEQHLTPSSARAAVVATDEADHMDAGEYLGKIPHVASTRALVQPAPKPGTTDNLASMRKRPSPVSVTKPDPVDGPMSEGTVGAQELDAEVDVINYVSIMQALRAHYDAQSLECLERKIYKVLRESDMRDVKVILTVYN
jgi:hypothetical protein